MAVARLDKVPGTKDIFPIRKTVTINSFNFMQ